MIAIRHFLVVGLQIEDINVFGHADFRYFQRLSLRLAFCMCFKVSAKIVTKSFLIRNKLIDFLAQKGIQSGMNYIFYI